MKKTITNVKIFLCIMSIIFVSFINLKQTYAASLSVSVNKKTVYVGETVTFTVRASGGAGNITIKGASNDSVWLDNSSKTYSVVASSVGTISLSASGVLGDYESEEDQKVSASATVKVIKKSNNSNGGNSTPTNNDNNNSSTDTKPKKEENKSNDNKLSSLTISKGTLSPKFSANTTSYKVDLTSDIETVDIAAKANDSKAKVTGTGKKDLVIGSQTYSVTVVSESGIKKVYSITFNVTEKPTVFTQFGDQKLGILKDVAKIEVPEGYKETTVTLEGEEIRGWKNDKTGLTLVYLADENGHKSFYIYSDGKVANKYELITIAGKKYTLLDIPSDMKEQEGLKADKVKIGDMELDGWSYEDKNHANYAVVYLMNEAGEKNLYSYEKTEGTLQKYVVSEEKKANNTLTYVLAGTTALFALSTLGVYMMYMNFKKKSIATIKDYYDRKNQG